jgi:hypothetical protein
MENFTTETIGCDLGDKMSDVCVMDAAGRTRRARVASIRKGMTTFFSREPAHVVIEVGGHSRWVSELLEGLGHRVTIANAQRVKPAARCSTSLQRSTTRFGFIHRWTMSRPKPMKETSTQLDPCPFFRGKISPLQRDYGWTVPFWTARGNSG